MAPGETALTYPLYILAKKAVISVTILKMPLLEYETPL